MINFQKWQKITLYLLSFAATISILQGFNNALAFSGDFQWSPSVLFWEGIDPYNYYLNGNENERIIMTQTPNYLHITYLMLYPFSMLDWESAKFAWALSSLCFAIIAAVILCKRAQLNLNETLFIVFIFLCSTPLRNTIGSGQHSTLVLLCFCGLFLQRKNFSESLIGLGFFKYSFMPPIFLYLVLSRGLKSAAFLSISGLIGWLLFSVYIGSNPLATLTLPIKVASGVVGDGTADVMTIAGFIFSKKESLLASIFIYSAPLLLSLAFVYHIMRNPGNTLYTFSMLAIASLVTFKHQPYDFLLLLPAFIYAFKHRASAKGKFSIALIFFNWFGLKAIAPLGIVPEILVPINFFVMLVLAALITKMRSRV